MPGSVRFGDWEVEAALGEGGEAMLSAAQLGSEVDRPRMARRRPDAAGRVGGTKSLQDLFTDRKVPRALRRSLPVVEADGEIVWVAGVAAAGTRGGEPVSLSTRASLG